MEGQAVGLEAGGPAGRPSGKVAVVGDRDTLPLFRSAGFLVYEAESQGDAYRAVSRAASRGDVVLIIVLKHVLSDPESFKSEASRHGVPVFVLPTRWSPGEPINVERLLARALGVG